VQRFADKKILLVPASPLNKLFAKELLSYGIEVVGFIDNFKKADDIYKPQELENISYDCIILQNKLFFDTLFKDLIAYSQKEKIFFYENNIVYDYKKIEEKSKQKDKQKFYMKIQKMITNIFDFYRFNRSEILFLQDQHLGTNVKALYSYLQKENIESSLIEVDPLLLKTYLQVARAKFIVMEEVIHTYIKTLSRRQKTLQLWHGVGIKKLNPIRDIKYSYFNSTSEWNNEVNFSKIFYAQEFINLGYPRNDLLFEKISTPFTKKLEKNKINIFYIPTYRDIDNSLAFDLDLLEKFLSQYEIYFYIKLHPFVKESISFDNYLHIDFLEDEAELYTLLPFCDLLISDYSSVMYDFLLLDRPIIAYCYDLEGYRESREGFLLDIYEYTPAPVVTTQQELLNQIEIFLNGNDSFKEKRAQIKKLFFDFVDNHSTKRLTQLVQKVVNE